MKTKTVPELIAEYGLKIPNTMSKDLIHALIDLVGGDEGFVNIHQKFLDGDNPYQINGLFRDREIYAFFIVNQDSLADYGSSASAFGAEGGLIHDLHHANKISTDRKMTFDEIAKLVYGKPSKIDQASKADIYIAEKLIDFAFTGLAESYANLIKTDSYEFYLSRINKN